MKKLFLMFAAVAMIFSSCNDDAKTDTENPNIENNGDNSDEDLEYDLLISLSSQSISIDKGETANFTVTYFGEDVTADAKIVNITGGGYEFLESTEFSTLRPGVHSFFAMYDNHSSEKIALNATSESNLSNTFYRRNLLPKFTATWCVHCPAMSKNIGLAQNLYPDRLIEMAIHCGDQLTTDYAGALEKMAGTAGYPATATDFDKTFATNQKTVNIIVNNAKQSLKNNPTVVGIKADAAIEGSKLSIDVESTFVADGNYKIMVALVQSGFNYEQTGTDDPNYRQNHVLRYMFQEETTGDRLDNVVKGEKIQKHYEMEMGDSVDQDIVDRSEIIVCILNDVGSAVYHVNNAISLGLNESVDYQYEPIQEDVE